MTISKKGLWWILVVLALAGCSTPPPQTPTVWPTSSPNPLTGTYWNLILLKGQVLLSGSRIILNFTEDEINGNAGCNDYGGYYYATGQQLRIVGVFQINVQGCAPQDLMAQEDAYVNTFTDAGRPAANYMITTTGSQTKLEILDANSQPILVYVKIDLDLYLTLRAATFPAVTPTPLPTFAATGTPAPTSLPLPTATSAPLNVSLGQPVWVGRGQIIDAAFLADGSGVLVGWGSGVSLNALDSGKELWYAAGPAPLVTLDVQPQGLSAAAAFTDGSLVIIDVASGQIRTTQDTKSNIDAGSLAWSPDGKTLAYQFIGSFGLDPVYLLDAASGQVSEIPNSAADAGRTPALLWSPDGKTISVASLGGTCGGLLDVASGVERMSLGKPNDCLVSQVGAWVPDGKALAVTGPSGEVELLSFPDGALLTKIANPGFLTAYPHSGQTLFFNPKGNRLANLNGLSEATTAPFDLITVWDTASGAIVARNFHPVTILDSFYRITAAFDGDSLLMLYGDGSATRWNFLSEDGEQTLFQLPVPAAAPWTLSWSQDGRRAAFTGSSGGVFVYDTGSGQAAGQFMGEYDSPALNRDGSLLALSDGQKREVQVIDLASGAAILHLPGKGIQGGEAFSPDGAYLAYSLGAHAAVVELATGKSQELVPTAQSAPAYGNRVMHLVWSPDSQALAVATGGGDQQNGKVALWQRDAAGGFQELTYVADLDANYPMSIVAVFNPSGTRVALQGSPNNEAGKTEVVVYDLQQHAFIQSMQAYLVGQWVNDGTLLMIEASGDCRLTRLDVVSGQKTVGHGDCAAGNVYAPNGLYYAQTDRIPTGITIYHWATGATLAHAEHGGGLIDTSWSPDGRGLATVGIDGTVRVWPVNYP